MARMLVEAHRSGCLADVMVIVAASGDVTDEDLIARENVVVTITSTGSAPRTPLPPRFCAL